MSFFTRLSPWVQSFLISLVTVSVPMMLLHVCGFPMPCSFTANDLPQYLVMFICLSTVLKMWVDYGIKKLK